NNKKLFLKNFSYTFISNLLSAGISIILVLIVPKFLDLNDYGMWQLYTFYSQYIAYTSLGITDGIYLRYGGVNFLDLPKSNLRSQFHFLIIFEIILGLSLLFVSKSVSTDLQFVYGMVALVGLLT